MTRKRLLFLGTACNSAARFAEAGSCSKVVNLRNLNGSLRPSGTAFKIYEPADSDRMLAYVHVCHEAHHYIFYKGTELYHEFDLDDTGCTVINQKLLTLDEEFTRIDSLGNTLIVICPSQIYYLLHRATGYVYLGNLPPMPVITLHEASYQFRSSYVPDYTITGKVEHFDDTVREGFTAREAGTYFKLRDTEHDNYRFVQPVAVRYALRLYDGSHILPSPPVILCCRNVAELQNEKYAFFNYIEDENTTYMTKYTVGLYSSTIGYRVESIDLDDWKDIVTGIDFFASAEVPLLSDEPIQSNNYVEVSQNRYQYTYKAPMVDIGQAVQQARDESLFYKIFSIDDLQNIVTNTLCEIEPETRPDYVIYQQRLTIDTADFNRMGAQQSFVYNNRLHLADITRTYYEGYPATLFHTTLSGTDVTAEACIRTRLLFSDGEDNFVVWRGKIPHCSSTLSPLLSYPDSNALSMEIAIRLNRYEYRHTFPLEAIGNENRASYIQQELADIDFTSWDKSAITAEATEDFPAESINIVRRHRNLLRVSEVDNPFFFPAELSYSISGGCITGIATTTAALSQGQYGEFPLYVFTDEGIWAMQNGDGEVCYARCTPINRECVSNSHCITTIENAIIYLAGKSLFMISGSQSAELLSLNEFPETLFDNQLSQLVPDMPAAGSDQRNLELFFDGNISSGYLYDKRELIFCNKSFPYIWVLHLATKHLYRRACSYQRIINGYNALLAQDDNGAVYDLNQETDTENEITLVTRPIAITSDTYTRLREVLLRLQGACSEMEITIVAAHEPEEAFIPIYKGVYNGNAGGHLPIRLAAPPYKYYRIILNGTVGSDFHIDCADLSADTVENNKLR